METNVSNVAKKDTGQINAKVIKTGGVSPFGKSFKPLIVALGSWYAIILKAFGIPIISKAFL